MLVLFEIEKFILTWLHLNYGTRLIIEKLKTVRLWMIQNSYDMIFITDVEMVCPEVKDFVLDMVTGNFDMV